MKITEEKGVTLVALVCVIIILIILSTVGFNSGKNVIEYSKFTSFKKELEILQTNVNELNQKNILEIGKELTQEQKNILEKDEISNIIYKNKTVEEQEKIEAGFRYFDKDTIKKEFNVANSKRDYIINIEYRYIIANNGVEYKGKTYYMINQFDDGLYNVEYNDKNEKTGTFKVISTKEDNRWKIQISEINYNGYIDNWKVKYRTSEEKSWTDANGLSFYISKEGNYYIKLVADNENISLEEQNIKIYNEYNDENLILRYDAIENSKDGEHDNSATMWKDLSSNSNDAKISGATWNENYLYFDGNNDFANTSLNIDFGNTKEVTIELIDIDGSFLEDKTNKNGVIFETSENWKESNSSFSIGINELAQETFSISINGENQKYNAKYLKKSNLESEKVDLYDIVINTNNEYNSYIKLYKNGKQIELLDYTNYNENISNLSLENYILYLGSRAGKSAFNKMKLGGVRIYNKELKQNQINENYKIDLIRFE